MSIIAIFPNLEKQSFRLEDISSNLIKELINESKKEVEKSLKIELNKKVYLSDKEILKLIFHIKMKISQEIIEMLNYDFKSRNQFQVLSTIREKIYKNKEKIIELIYLGIKEGKLSTNVIYLDEYKKLKGRF